MFLYCGIRTIHRLGKVAKCLKVLLKIGEYSEVMRRTSSESGFTIVLLALTLLVVIGGVAIVVDLGNTMLARERTTTANDLAALSVSQLLFVGESEDAAKVHGQYVAISGRILNSSSPDSNLWGNMLPRVNIKLDPEIITLKHTLQQVQYFSSVLGFTTPINVSLSSYAAGSFDAQDQSVHFVVVVDAGDMVDFLHGGCTFELEKDIPYDDNFCEGSSTYCVPGCSSFAWAREVYLRTLINNLMPSDRLTLIQYGMIAETVVSNVKMNDEGRNYALESVHKIGNFNEFTESHPASSACLPPDCLRAGYFGGDVGAGLYVARDSVEDLQLSSDADQIAVVVVSSGIFLSPTEVAIQAHHGNFSQSDLEPVGDYTDYEGELFNLRDSWEGCEIETRIEENVEVIVNAAIEFAGLAASDIEGLGSRVFTVGLFRSSENSAVKKRNKTAGDILLNIAGDLTRVRASNDSDLGCSSGTRNRELAGRFYNPQPWTVSYDDAVNRLLRNARRSTTEIAVTEPRLVAHD